MSSVLRHRATASASATLTLLGLSPSRGRTPTTTSPFTGGGCGGDRHDTPDGRGRDALNPFEWYYSSSSTSSLVGTPLRCRRADSPPHATERNSAPFATIARRTPQRYTGLPWKHHQSEKDDVCEDDDLVACDAAIRSLPRPSPRNDCTAATTTAVEEDEPTTTTTTTPPVAASVPRPLLQRRCSSVSSGPHGTACTSTLHSPAPSTRRLLYPSVVHLSSTALALGRRHYGAYSTPPPLERVGALWTLHAALPHGTPDAPNPGLPRTDVTRWFHDRYPTLFSASHASLFDWAAFESAIAAHPALFEWGPDSALRRRYGDSTAVSHRPTDRKPIIPEKADNDRVAAEQAEAERVAAEQAEAERVAAEQAEAERVGAEQAEAERVAIQKAEAERVAAEKAEAERVAAEQAEAERVAAEQAEAERAAIQKAEAERVAAEQAEAERAAIQKAEAERVAAEQAEAERVAIEKAEAERVAAEQAEAERVAAEKAEAERAAIQKAEAERVAAEQAEAERVAAEQAEAERVAAEQAEAERAAIQKAEAERVAAEQAEAERAAIQKAEAERVAIEKAEAERVAAEQAEAERVAIVQAEAERLGETEVSSTLNLAAGHEKRSTGDAVGAESCIEEVERSEGAVGSAVAAPEDPERCHDDREDGEVPTSRATKEGRSFSETPVAEEENTAIAPSSGDEDNHSTQAVEAVLRRTLRRALRATAGPSSAQRGAETPDSAAPWIPVEHVLLDPAAIEAIEADAASEAAEHGEFPDASVSRLLWRRSSASSPSRRVWEALQQLAAEKTPARDEANHPPLSLVMDFQLQPRRPLRRATVLVDGDALSAEAIDAMCSALQLDKEGGQCRLVIVRQPGSPPCAEVDTVAPSHVFVPTPALVERKAHEWFTLPTTTTGAVVVLEDVIYMCAASQWNLYRQEIVCRHDVPDADVYLCCPSRVELVSPKQWKPAF